jgi:hypothetical protein
MRARSRDTARVRALFGIHGRELAIEASDTEGIRVERGAYDGRERRNKRKKRRVKAKKEKASSTTTQKCHGMECKMVHVQSRPLFASPAAFLHHPVSLSLFLSLACCLRQPAFLVATAAAAAAAATH